MTDKTINSTLDAFPITQRWAPAYPDRIQLYSLGTPNGVKVSIALEELGLPYEAHRVTLSDADVKSPAFLSLNPNNKIPAIIDPNGPNDQPLALFESGAILIYLAEKTDRLLGASIAERYEVMQWLMFQMGGVGPMFGQLGFFYAFAGKEIADPRPRERYIAEVKRLLNVINGRLEGRDWIAGDYSIADIAIAPWLDTIGRFYKASDVTEFNSFTRVTSYLARFNARPAVQRGWNVPQQIDQ